MGSTITYPVSYRFGLDGSDAVVIHGAGTGDGPKDKLNNDKTKWDIAFTVPAADDDAEYATGLARVGFEPAGFEVDDDGLRTGRRLVRRIEKISANDLAPHQVWSRDMFPSKSAARSASFQLALWRSLGLV